jgi:ABC-type sugar transport system ATPase subunit
MDEPLSTLDDELNKQLREEILRLHSDLGFTLVYVTHSRVEAKELGTRTIHIRQGRVEQENALRGRSREDIHEPPAA